MIQIMRVSWLLLLCVALSHTTFAQIYSSVNSPYEFHLKKDVPIIGAGIGLMIGGVVVAKDVKPFTQQELSGLNKNQINAFDRRAINFWSPKLSHLSDYFLYGSLFFPVSLGLDKEIRNNALETGILLGQTISITQGLTAVSKAGAKRNRPYLYNDLAPDKFKEKITSRLSFFSGHTATVASYSFFTAKIWSDYHPDSKWKPLVWGAAATIPAITGYARYRAGRHFPTDVITGYAVGAAVGFLVPHLHLKKKGSNASLRSAGSGDNFRLIYNRTF